MDHHCPKCQNKMNWTITQYLKIIFFLAPLICFECKTKLKYSHPKKGWNIYFQLIVLAVAMGLWALFHYLLGVELLYALFFSILVAWVLEIILDYKLKALVEC